jgi:hypothetical protein
LAYHIKQDAALPPLHSFQESNYTSFRANSLTWLDRDDCISVNTFVRPAKKTTEAERTLRFDASPAWQLFSDSGLPCFEKTLHGGLCWRAKYDKDSQFLDIQLGPKNFWEEKALHPFCYPLDQLITMQILPDIQGMLVHATAMIYQERAWVFPGVSGAGKSTLSRILRKSLPGIKILSDDRIIIRCINNEWFAFGTPWPGEGAFAEHDGAALGGVHLLIQAPSPALRELSSSALLKRFLPTVCIQWFDTYHCEKSLELCEKLIAAKRVSAFHFTADERSADYLAKEISQA